MKKSAVLLIIIALLILCLNACSNRATEEYGDISSAVGENDSETYDNKEHVWYYVPLSHLKDEYSGTAAFYNSDHPYIHLSKNETDLLKSVCDENGNFMSTTIINENKTGGKYTYYNGQILKYSISVADDLDNKYDIVIGLLPEQYRGMTSEAILKTATDYCKLFDIETGKTMTAGVEIEYAFRNADENTNAFAFAVIKDNWFALAVPENPESKTATEPQTMFDKTVFEIQNLETPDDFMISSAQKTNGITVITSGTAESPTKKYTVYGEDGKEAVSFEASSFFADSRDQTGRVWCIRYYNEQNNTISERHYCNIFGKKLPLDDATDVICLNEKEGEYIGIYKESLYIYDGSGKAEKTELEYESVKTVGNIEAVKYNDVIYGLLKDEKPYRLYETDLRHDDAALEYKPEYNAIFIGGDAVFAVVNSKGELIETSYYSDFEKDPKGRGYLLGYIRMSLEGDTHILDGETFEILAYLPAAANYEFTSDGRIKVSYNDSENNNEYVEFTVSVEQAIKHYSEQSDHACFTGYPTEEDFN